MSRSIAVALALLASLSAPSAVARQAAPEESRAKARQLAQQAAAAEELGNVEEAVTLLRAALEVEPSDAAATTSLGRLLCANDEGAEGLALLYHALQLDPKSVEAAIALVDVLLAQRDVAFAEGDAATADATLAQAREIVERAVAASTKPPPELELRRLRVLARGDEGGKAAFEIATRLVAEAPENQTFHAALVEAATAGKEFDAALAFYEKGGTKPWLAAYFTAEVRAARATWNFNHFADDEQAAKDYLEADRLVLESARLEPTIFDAASERASYYRSWAGWVRFTRQQRTEEAWELFVSAWGRDPGNASAIEGMSWVCQRLYEAGDREEQTREYSRQMCVVAPDRPDFWNNYGLVCRDSGHFEESFRAYRRAMELAPDDARIVNDCALILLYHLHRDLDLCERWFIRAEDLARARFEMAKRDQDEAAMNEQRGVVGDALTNLARLYAEQGRMQESAQEWSELRELDPARPELPENGGEANLPAAPPNPPPADGGAK